MIDGFATVAALGAWHGINPAMGWLFAAALAMQERTERAAWRALLPLAVGHAGAVAAALGVAVVLSAVVSFEWLGRIGGLALIGFGIYRLVSSRHPTPRSGMRVGARQLAVWSFVMASAHGAGLMVVPFAVRGNSTASHHGGHGGAALAGNGVDLFLPTLVHSGAYLVVTGLLAWSVYRWIGVGFLRRWWINVDLVWAVALILTGIVGVLPH